MKQNIIKILAVIALAAFSANASAVLMSVVDQYDTLRASTNLGNSGDAGEELWIEAELGVGIEYTKLSNGEGANWVSVTDGATGDYAFDFGSGVNPDFFLVKTGNIKNGLSHFLFTNNDSTQWGYINLSLFGAEIRDINIGKFSHVAISNGCTEPNGCKGVPAPGIMAMLATGLLLIGVARRKMKV